VAKVAWKTAHGLRKLRARIMAENGARTHQIAARTGHESLVEVARYSLDADRCRTMSGTESADASGKAGNPARKWMNYRLIFGSGAPGRIRTPDPQIRSLVLYPAELPVRERGI